MRAGYKSEWNSKLDRCQNTPQLFLLFNHRLTPAQEAAAREQLGVTRLVPLPPELHARWSQVPPDLPSLAAYLQPLRDWLAAVARNGDYVLIQGDFGATWLMVQFALERGLIPIYATSRREAVEEHQADGSVKMVHRFRHERFRRYGE